MYYSSHINEVENILMKNFNSSNDIIIDASISLYNKKSHTSILKLNPHIINNLLNILIKFQLPL